MTTVDEQLDALGKLNAATRARDVALAELDLAHGEIRELWDTVRRLRVALDEAEHRSEYGPWTATAIPNRVEAVVDRTGRRHERQPDAPGQWYPCDSTGRRLPATINTGALLHFYGPLTEAAS